MPIAFSICSNNYLAKARVTSETFLLKHPDYQFFIFLVDTFVSEIDYHAFGKTEVIAIKDIVPDIETLAIKYNIIELNTAVKPAVFSYLFQRYQSSHIFYLDPDLMIFDRFTEIEELFEKETYNLIITPHGCSPIDDGKVPSEIHLSTYGLYNLGFLAVKNSAESQRFLAFWHERLMKYCYIDPEHGMFTDQLWVNYAPIYFDGVLIFKHLGYNVANWNLYERRIEKAGDSYNVNGAVKLKFFHFSHYKFTDPHLISYKQNRHTIEEFEDLRTIIDAYQSKLIDYKHEFYNTIPCSYQQLYESHYLQQRKVNGRLRTIVRNAKNKAILVTHRLFVPSSKNN
ncbi:MAG: hypothetical protein ABIN01_23765 [Ferruginibacter sp.]